MAMIARQAKFLKMVSGKMGMYTHESTNLLVAGGSVDLVSRDGISSTQVHGAIKPEKFKLG